MKDNCQPYDSCQALSALHADTESFMAHLLDAANAVKAEHGFSDNESAFDYTVSFLSGVYRALALVGREATLAAMDDRDRERAS